MPEFNQVANIKVFGVGGGGSNAVNRMVADGVKGVDFFICNTDVQVMKNSPAENKIVLGKETTKGLGAGGNPEYGRKAAEESENEIRLHHSRNGRRNRNWRGSSCCKDRKRRRGFDRCGRNSSFHI